MQCPGCKVEVDPQVKFCPECGGAIAAAAPGAPLAAAGESGGKAEGETEIWQGCYSGKAMIGIWVLLGAISVVCIVGASWSTQREDF